MDKELKIALCLVGQYRTFDSEIVQKTMKYFILDKYKCDVFFSTWDDRGVSLNHNNPMYYKDKNEKITEDHIKRFIPNCYIEIENYKQWEHTLNREYKALLHFLTDTFPLYSGMLPQLYKKYKCVNMLKDSYDFVIVTRPDLVFWDELEIERCILKKNTVWNINPTTSKAYYPNRIYDIFLAGNQDDIKKLVECYFNITLLMDDPFNSHLGQFDCCKMLYIYAKKYCKLEVESLTNFISEAYRGETTEEYIKHYSTYCNLEKLKTIL